MDGRMWSSHTVFIHFLQNASNGTQCNRTAGKFQNMAISLQVPTTLNSKSPVFWDAMSCSLVYRYQHFGGACCLHLQGSLLSLDYTYDGSPRLHQNVSTCISIHTASYAITHTHLWCAISLCLFWGYWNCNGQRSFLNSHIIYNIPFASWISCPGNIVLTSNFLQIALLHPPQFYVWTFLY